MTGELERQLAALKQGEHLCPIHENLAEEIAGAVFFIQRGLACREALSVSRLRPRGR